VMVKIPSSTKDSLPHNTVLLERAQHEDRGSVDLELLQSALLDSAYQGAIELVDGFLELVAIDTADKATGMTALHLAVGRNHLDVVRLLVDRGASFLPDKQGRMPTTIAAECEVSEELCDFIVEAEAAAEARAEGV
jgi:ankyrin repeat protein